MEARTPIGPFPVSAADTGTRSHAAWMSATLRPWSPRHLDEHNYKHLARSGLLLVATCRHSGLIRRSQARRQLRSKPIMALMKRLMIFLVMGCGATQGDEPDRPKGETPPQQIPSQQVSIMDAGAAKLTTPIERRLYPQKFSSTSHLENDWNKFQENYLAAYLGDDNPETSWTEGKQDVGIGERIMIEHTPLDDASKVRLEIRNGYQKTPRLFTRNARAKDIEVTLKPSGLTSKHTLTDSEGWQSVVLEQPTGPLTGYEIRFDSVYKGTHYEDLVVSDIQTYVTALTPDNPAYETSKQKRLLDWAADRKLAAKTFKEAAKGSMPVAANYKTTVIAEHKSECSEDTGECPLPFQRASSKWGKGKPIFGSLEAAAQENFQGWKQVRISTTDKRPVPRADNFRFPGSWWGDILIYEGDEAAILLPAPRLLAYFNAKNLQRVYVETNAVTAESAIRGKVPDCKREGKDSHFFFTPETKGPLRTLLIATCGLYEDREGYSLGRYWQLLRYEDDGALGYLFDFYSASLFSWTKKDGAPFLSSITRVSTAGASDTRFTAK